MVYFIHWIGYFILLLFTPGNFIELLKLNSVLLLHMKATGERDGVFERIHIHLKKVKLQGHNIPCISTEAFGGKFMIEGGPPSSRSLTSGLGVYHSALSSTG